MSVKKAGSGGRVAGISGSIGVAIAYGGSIMGKTSAKWAVASTQKTSSLSERCAWEVVAWGD